ncbi:MAG: ECF transporter S component [Promethearchaeota archaeon]|jgi:riboflavin transporter FmnP
MSEAKIGEIEVVRTKRTKLIIQIAGGAIFGGLSAVVSFVLSPIINASRIPGWQIAMFDPTSWIWIICFLIFGPIAGLISCATGSVGLLLIDPSGWVGPVFKFTATVPLILIPYFIFKLKDSRKLKKPRNYVISGVASTAVRIIAMLGLNLLFFATIWSSFFQFMSLEILGLGNITGLTAVLIFAPIINLYTSVLDLLVPYLLVFLPKLDEKFDFW